jgi:TRAP-type mannitol/chloroaromatic compound transport system permease small subunit
MSETVGKFASFFIIIMVAFEFLEVVMRYFVGRPLNWTWEVATYMYGANFMLGGAWALLRGKHVRTDILYDKLSQKRKAIIDLCTFSTVFLLFCGVLTVLTIKAAIFSVSINEFSYVIGGKIPVYPLKITIAIGFIILFFQGLAKIARDIIFLTKGETV